MLDLVETITFLVIPAFIIGYFKELWVTFWENPQEILVNATTAIIKTVMRDLVLPGKKILVLVIQSGKEIMLKVKEILSLVIYIGGQAIQSVENILKLISTILSGFNNVFTTTNKINRIIPLEYIWTVLFLSCVVTIVSIAIYKVKKIFKDKDY